MYCDVVALKFELNLAGIMGKRDGRGETYSTTKDTARWYWIKRVQMFFADFYTLMGQIMYKQIAAESDL